MYDPGRAAALTFALILFSVLLPAAFYAYMAHRKASWRKKINVVWRRHTTRR